MSAAGRRRGARERLRSSAILGLLADRNYAIYTVGNTFSLLGTWIHRIAISWLVWELTHSPFWIGVVALTGFLAMALIAPIGGVLADRYDQTRQIVISQFLAFLLMLALYAVYRAGMLDIWTLILFRVLLTGLVSLSQPARLVLVPRLVGRAQMNAAISLGAVIFNLTRFLGPGVAALFLIGGNFGPAFLLNGFSYLALVVAMLLIRLQPDDAIVAPEKVGMAAGVGRSIAYVVKTPGIAAMFLLFGVGVIAGRPISEMLPAFVGQVYQRGPEALAILTSAMATGSILGGLWSAERRLEDLTRAALTSGVLYGLCILVFAWLPLFWLAVPMLALASVFNVTNGVSSQTLVQLGVAPEMRGRVLSLWFVLSRGGPSLGAFVFGALAQHVGLAAPFTAGALLTILVSAFVWTRRDRLVRLLTPPSPP